LDFSRTFPIESFDDDSGPTLVCAEYGYPKGSPNTTTVKEEIRRYSSQYSARLSTYPNDQRPAYQIPSVIVVFVILVFKA
jgi:hypothetical protein